MLAVRTEGLGKRYRRGQHLDPYKTFRESLSGLVRRRPARANGKGSDWFWALHDVEFELEEGQALGVIGSNGAGKSTLLKVLSSITKPTTGRAEIRGRVGTLLEVGTGFHPELTGRENVRLNAAILGMTRREIASRFDEIVEFAEVEQFIDTPVKRYSTGMQVRLAFAVAAHLHPDVLIVDEVLAVGDAAFQRKCLGKLGEVGIDGRTVLFVSHNMAAVEQLCTRAVLLSKGTVARQGEVHEVIEHYMQNVSATDAETTFEPPDDTRAAILRMATRGRSGEATTYLRNDEPITLEVEFEAREGLRDDHLWFALYRADGLMMAKHSDDDGGPVAEYREPGRYVARWSMPGNVLNEGMYQFRVVVGKRKGVHHDDRYGGYFEVEDTTDYTNSDFGKRAGLLLLPVRYEEQREEAHAR
jgi:lipopolysaccharide transport system ATP-binding protein